MVRDITTVQCGRYLQDGPPWESTGITATCPPIPTCAPMHFWLWTARSATSRRFFRATTTSHSLQVHPTKFGPQRWSSARFCAGSSDYRRTRKPTRSRSRPTFPRTGSHSGFITFAWERRAPIFNITGRSAALRWRPPEPEPVIAGSNFLHPSVGARPLSARR